MSGIHEEGLIRKGSAEEIVVKRDSVVRMYQSAIEQFQKAQEMQKELACSDYAYVSFQIDRHHWLPDSEGTYVRKLVDKSVWTYLLDAMGFRSLMDEKALSEWEKGLENPPEVTLENIYGTLESLNAQKHRIFRRGIVNVFRKLSHEYARHDAFKLGKGVILKYAISTFYMNRRAEIDDVDRIFHILDGKAPPDHRGGLASLIDLAIHKKERTVETEYFRAQWYKNQNLHLWFKRADLVTLANRLIAEECGEVLPQTA